MSLLDYTSTLTADDFHLDNSFVRLLFGPVGCGKSFANCMEIFRRALEQEPASDGIRYSRWAVCRNTYPELKSTTIRTWLDWFPEKIFGKIKYDSPITHVIRIGDVHLEVLFLPLGCDDDLSKLKSLELTGIYFNELQFFSEFLFEESLERVNRYPGKKLGCGITWTGAIADTNPPDSQHWIYKRFEVLSPEGQKIFKYLPAVLKVEKLKYDSQEHAYSLDGTLYIKNEKADYAMNQQAGSHYWLNLVKSHNDDTIKVSYMGEYGLVRKNRRVYPEYNDQIHCVQNISYHKMTELGMGWDFGNTPAVVFCQLSVHGHFMILDELVCDGGGLDAFCQEIVIPHLNRNYAGWQKNFKSVGDPAGVAPSPTDAKTCFEILAKNGIRTRPAKTNAYTPRREAVSFFLRRMIGGRPALMISPKAIVVRQGFNGDYYYMRVNVKHDERYKEEPDKNFASHPHDALQYIAMEYQDIYERPLGVNKEGLTGTLIS